MNTKNHINRMILVVDPDEEETNDSAGAAAGYKD